MLKIKHLLSFLCLIALCVCTTQAQSGATPYEPNDRIDIDKNGVRTVLYPDKQSPYTDFWYLPGLLSIERRKQGGRSRLSFSLELHQSADTKKADYVQLNMVIAPGYQAFYEKSVKTTLTNMGRTIVDPLNPEESYKAVNLHPIQARIKKAVFADLFPTAIWLNQDTFRKHDIRLDRPFPLQFRLSHEDATILLESLLQKRSCRVAQIETESGDYLPIYLSLDIPDSEMPLEYNSEQKGKDWIVRFSNPTEQHIILEGITRFSESRSDWVYEALSDTLKPFTDQTKAPGIANLTLNEKPGEISQVKWRALPDYQEMISFYIKNRTPAPPLQINYLFDPRDGNLLTHFKDLALQIEMVDNIGLCHTRTIPIWPGNMRDKILLSGFLGARTLKYAISGHLIDQPEALWSGWESYPATFLGDEVSLYLNDIMHSAIMGVRSEDWKRIGNAWVKEDKHNATVIPCLLYLMKTDDDIPLLEFRQVSGKIQGYLALRAHLLPGDLECVKNTLRKNENFKTVRLSAAALSLHLGDFLIAESVAPEIDNRGVMHVRFSLEGADYERFRKTINERKMPLTIRGKLFWQDQAERYSTIYLMELSME